MREAGRGQNWAADHEASQAWEGVDLVADSAAKSYVPSQARKPDNVSLVQCPRRTHIQAHPLGTLLVHTEDLCSFILRRLLAVSLAPLNTAAAILAVLILGLGSIGVGYKSESLQCLHAGIAAIQLSLAEFDYHPQKKMAR